MPMMPMIPMLPTQPPNPSNQPLHAEKLGDRYRTKKGNTRCGKYVPLDQPHVQSSPKRNRTEGADVYMYTPRVPSPLRGFDIRLHFSDSKVRQLGLRYH